MHIEIRGYEEKTLRETEVLISAFIDQQGGKIGGDKITLGICKEEKPRKHEIGEVSLRIYMNKITLISCLKYLLPKLETFRLRFQFIQL
ncbi:MAG: hypothetical protein ABII74_05695 [Elusimicrobiota bacterium]